MISTVDETKNWWGTFEFSPGHTLQLACADMNMVFTCQQHQWWLGYQWQKHLNQVVPEVLAVNEAIDMTVFEKQQRIVFSKLPSELTLRPALADRPVVCRPVVTVSLLPHQQVSLFVCLPLWIQLWSEQSREVLLDVPSVKVCDTWFGANSREGTISYASRVSEQLDVKPISNNLSRAAIEVRIQNQSSELLNLDKISIPAPNLSLYADDKGQLWTPRITMVRRDNSDATLSVEDEMSCGLKKQALTLVTSAREDLGKHKITKAISALFG